MNIDRFIPENIKALLNKSRELALYLNHKEIGVEHLLLALLERAEEDIGLADGKQIKEELLDIVGQLYIEADEAQALITFTPRLHKLLASAIQYAEQKKTRLDNRMLWRFLLKERESIAIRLLVSAGVEIADIEENLDQMPNQNEQGDKNFLAKFGQDLTELAKNKALDPVFTRDLEIERIIQILSRRRKNNPLLIGDAGVGKSAVIEGLAQKIADGSLPGEMAGKRLVMLEMGSLVAGTKFRGDFEERIQGIIEQVKSDKNVVLFIDEIHTIVGAGKAEGSVDAANLLKPALARGDIQCIGATTYQGYSKYIEKDSALSRRFQPVFIEEPSRNAAKDILLGLKEKYETHHHVLISEAAIDAAIQLSVRYLNDRFLPDKAIDLIDEAASRIRLLSDKAVHERNKPLLLQLAELENEKHAAAKAHKFDMAAQYKEKINDIKQQMDEEIAPRTVSKEDIAEVVSAWTGIPMTQMSRDESERMLHLEEELHRRVVGQPEAVSAVSRALRRAKTGLRDPKRPIASFLFLGPTGVGKTELCKALAESMFGDEEAIVRLDMSEYMEKHNVSKMIGSPPGYVGYEEGGILTEQIRKRPYSVVLLDEIEKAHPDVFNILLQILEDGRLSDSFGQTTSFRNCIIVMTSNAGVSEITNAKSLGFGVDYAALPDDNKVKSDSLEAIKQYFKPEFLNRLDEIIVFHKLDEAALIQISQLLLNKLAERVSEQGFKIHFEKSVASYIAKNGADMKFGARPLRRFIQRQIEDEVSEKILLNAINKGDAIKVKARRNKIVFETL